MQNEQLSKKTILVVEDEALVAAIIRQDLLDMGYDCPPPISNSREVLEFIEKTHTDAIITDVKIKGKIDGIETAQKIKKYFNIPIIIMSALLDETTIERAKKIQPAAIITKPIACNRLKKIIEKALEE